MNDPNAIYRVRRLPNSENTVIIGGQSFHVRFRAKDADHLLESYGSNPDHDVKARDILRIVKNSLLIRLKEDGNKFLCLNRYNDKVYNAFCRIEEDIIDVITCYRCNRPHLIKLYESHE